jgi:hypothetical protein
MNETPQAEMISCVVCMQLLTAFRGYCFYYRRGYSDVCASYVCTFVKNAHTHVHMY